VKSVKNILNEIRPDVDFGTSIDFVEDGLLDSFDVVTLVTELEANFSVSITGTDIIPENFRSLPAIESLLDKSGVRQ
jgi:methoxymalonate biosynthesis acyl carrier protein